MPLEQVLRMKIKSIKAYYRTYRWYGSGSAPREAIKQFKHQKTSKITYHFHI